MSFFRRALGFRAHRRPLRHPDARGRVPTRPGPDLRCEQLENRTLLSFPPLPIDPDKGESQLLQQARRFEERSNLNALDHFPIPFAVAAEHDGSTVIVENNPHSAAPMKLEIDVDSDLTTGQGGKDVAVQVSTELFLNGDFNPHLLVGIDRLGSAPFASGFEVLVSFPFDAFTPEALSPSANLFIGYKTTGAGGPDDVGGIAPLSETIRFIPDILGNPGDSIGGTTHGVRIELDTVGAENPLQFITGHFDGTGGATGTGILNADAVAAWVQNVPASIDIGLNVTNSFPLGTPLAGSLALTWDASDRSKVVFDYLERESGPDLSDTDFNTTVTFDLMPTHEELSLSIDETASAFTLSHVASHTIDQITILSQRGDGLEIIGTLSDVPRNVHLTVDLAGSATLDVEDDVADDENTLDAHLEIKKEGGFLDTADFLGYDVGYISVGLENVPDLFIGYDPADNSVGVNAINPGECIGAVELVIGDDEILELPPFQEELGFAPWDDPNPRHVFSLIDIVEDPEAAELVRHGTAAARLVNVQEASLSLDAADIAEAFTFITCEAAPLTAYIRTVEDSLLIPGHDVEITLNIVDIPAGQVGFSADFPTGFTYQLPDGERIEEIHAFGHIDCVYFDVRLGDLPEVFEFNFDPNGLVLLRAEDGSGPSTDRVGVIEVHLYIPDPECEGGLLADSGLPDFLGAPLREARLRLDDIPSFDATWTDGANTSVNFNTIAETGDFAFLGGAQVAISTEFTPPDGMDLLSAADVGAAHYLVFRDNGTDTAPDPDVPLQKTFAAGAFGINSVTYASDDAAGTYAVSYVADSPHVLSVTFDSRFGGVFFPEYDIDLGLVVEAVPTEFTLASDLATQFVYEASDQIDSITLVGTVDDTNDSANNGVDVTFALLGLPSELRIGIIPDEIEVIDGRLDMSGNGSLGSDDDGFVAGVEVLDGRLDLDGTGTIDGGDAGQFFGIAVIGGELNIDGNGAVDGDDDGGLAGAEVFANGPINEVGFKLESIDNSVGIFGEHYRLIQALATGVPARMVLSYGGDRFFFNTADASGNPDSLDEVTAIVSTSNSTTDNNAKAFPFTVNGPTQGGPILGDPAVTGVAGESGSRIRYSHFLQEVDRRYYNEGVATPAPLLGRLAELYADSAQLDLGEDHLIVRKEDLKGGDGDDTIGFASFNFNDFQHASWTPDANGGQFIYAAPGRGDESFFAGQEVDNEYTTIEIQHVPDSIVVDIDDTEHVVYTASSSPGEIDLYKGPGSDADGMFAEEDDDAIRAIMRNAPSNVRIFWDFSFPNGGAFMDADAEFELLFLTQDGNTRITAGVTLEDLHIGWGIELFSFDVTKSIEIWNPIPDCPNLIIPVAWELFQARAGIDNNADGLTLANVGHPDQVAAAPGEPDVAGFFALYNFENSPSALVDPAGPGASGGEYIPFLTIQSEGFRLFAMDFIIELDPTNPDADLYPIDLEFNIDTTQVGQLVLDIWSPHNTHFTDDDAIPFIPEVGFVNVPDYTDNTPFHILPGLFEDFIGNGLAGIHIAIPDTWVITFDGWHNFNDHFDPFDGSIAPPFDGNDSGGGFNAGDIGFIVDALGVFAGALNRWEGVLASSGVYTPEQASALITDVANNTLIEIFNFADPILGDASGTSAGATIRIDPDAGGFEWFIDPTPFGIGGPAPGDTEFEGGGPAPDDLIADPGEGADGKVDLLTFFIHEIGHILGFGHATDGVMQATLPRGVRRLPVDEDVIPGAPPPAAPAADDTAALTVEDDEDDEEEDTPAALLG